MISSSPSGISAQLITIVGARPQFVKAAVVSKALRQAGITEAIIHTGQHYDANMSQVFFDELDIPPPRLNLEIGSGHHGAQTGQMLEKIEACLLAMPQLPRFLMVYGDTNSTLAGALAAAKLHVPVIHVEAGLRSFNRRMPEEINRITTDHLSDMLCCSSSAGVKQLAKEGITKGVYNVGDVMQDAVQLFGARPSAELPEPLEAGNPFPELKPENYLLFTLHRPANTDAPERLHSILEAINTIKKPVIWPVHPRVKSRLGELRLPENLHPVAPLPYISLLGLLKNAAAVLTDSGGLQKEAYWLRRPCITLREETEWTETLEGGWNRLAGADTARITQALHTLPQTPWKPLYGDTPRKLARMGCLHAGPARRNGMPQLSLAGRAARYKTTHFRFV
ncbi:MAG: non-hydrolyzing UDP-N-acetylglucosamine 2-epimerase [Cyclonatronaceae bacterium]